MARSIFFSWQSDTLELTGKKFLEDILQEICSQISSDTALVEAVREQIILDKDTKDVPGQPPVFQTILDKIDRAGVFVADLTFVGDRKNKKGPIPNPNVLIEQGYALKALGHERIKYVMNSAYGAPNEANLPFDLRHVVWPIQYNLKDNATEAEIAEERNRLLPILRRAIEECLGVAKQTSKEVELSDEFPQQKELGGPGRFRPTGTELGIYDDWRGFSDEKNDKKILLSSGAIMWLRVMPAHGPGLRLKSTQQKKIVEGGYGNFTTLLGNGGGYDHLRAEDGMGFYGPVADGYKNAISPEIDAVSFLFHTGEIWSIDGFYLGHGSVIPFVEPRFARTLKAHTEILRTLGVIGPFKWIAGMTGVKGKRLAMPPPPPGKEYFEKLGNACVANTIIAEGRFEGGENPIHILKPLFEELYDKCGWERPEYLDSL